MKIGRKKRSMRAVAAMPNVEDISSVRTNESRTAANGRPRLPFDSGKPPLHFRRVNMDRIKNTI